MASDTRTVGSRGQGTIPKELRERLGIYGGDEVVVQLDPTKGSERRGTRPCLVVQNDAGNENAPATIVIPFTTSFDDELYPFEVLVEADEGPPLEDSVALCSQIRTVSIAHRISKNLGPIPADRMEQVDRALEYSLGWPGVAEQPPVSLLGTAAPQPLNAPRTFLR